MMIQTLHGNFVQYRTICAVNRNNDVITASLICGEHHDLYKGGDVITYNQNEEFIYYLSVKNITERLLTQKDINEYMKRHK